jgi:ribose transport system permease protein
MNVKNETPAIATAPASEPTAAVPSARRRAPAPPQRVSDLVNRYGLLGVFAVIVLLFSLLKPDTFPTTANAQSIASTQAVVALLALAATMPLIVGHFDVSIGFQLGLSQTLCAGLIINNGWSPVPAAIVAVASCVVVGLVNAILVTKVRLVSFIATLGVGTVVLGLTQLYGKDATISGALPTSFTDLGRNTVLGVPLPFIYVVILAAILWFAFEYTFWGREAHATGGNPRAALLAGVRTDRVTFMCFVYAGLISGLAGVLSVLILGAAAPTVGLGSLLPAYAAAFLGATAIRPGRFNAIGTVLGIYLLAAGIIGLQQLGAQFYVEQLFNGGALLIALILSAAATARSGRARAT